MTYGSERYGAASANAPREAFPSPHHFFGGIVGLLLDTSAELATRYLVDEETVPRGATHPPGKEVAKGVFLRVVRLGGYITIILAGTAFSSPLFVSVGMAGVISSSCWLLYKICKWCFWKVPKAWRQAQQLSDTYLALVNIGMPEGVVRTHIASHLD
ncbi:hypothetical protein TrST_g3813 [Triparma strigata]|uniref:Uncharacterized protein n=1 Tax=Triparma strigata TaxID=1606541 RepID=A0A9W7BLP8_9STRA|nr:hypothetical protein TrST_g3813 [Triparma strigata]